MLVRRKNQLSVHKIYRTKIMTLAHEGFLSGCFSQHKISVKNNQKFSWQGSCADIEIFCKACDTYQQVTLKGIVKSFAPSQLPVISDLFLKVAIYVIVPIFSKCSWNHIYIFTVIVCATRSPEVLSMSQCFQ